MMPPWRVMVPTHRSHPTSIVFFSLLVWPKDRGKNTYRRKWQYDPPWCRGIDITLYIYICIIRRIDLCIWLYPKYQLPDIYISRLKARRDFMWKKHHKHVIRPFGKIDIGATPLHFFPKTSLNLEFWKVKIFSLWHLHVWLSFWRTWQHKWMKPSNKMQIKKGVLCHLSIRLPCPACNFERSHEHQWFYKSIGFDSWFVLSNQKALSCHLME